MDYEFRMEQMSLINDESIKFSFLKDIKELIHFMILQL